MPFKTAVIPSTANSHSPRVLSLFSFAEKFPIREGILAGWLPSIPWIKILLTGRQLIKTFCSLIHVPSAVFLILSSIDLVMKSKFWNLKIKICFLVHFSSYLI